MALLRSQRTSAPEISERDALSDIAGMYFRDLSCLQNWTETVLAGSSISAKLNLPIDMNASGQYRLYSLSAFLVPLLVITTFSLTSSASVSNVYISQSGTGSGTNCSDTRSASWFNNEGNWGSGSTQIGPGTTVHLCGTFTGSAGATELTFQGSGSSGNIITLRFEPGVLLTAPYWSATGAINTNGATWITVDGGTNGTIENTLNGSSGGSCIAGSCAYQQSSRLVYISGCAVCNVEVRNLTLIDVYVHSSANDDGGKFTDGIYFSGSAHNNITIDYNTIHDSWLCLDGNGSNITVNNNELYNCAGGFWWATTAPSSGLHIHDNYFHDPQKWVTNDDTFHLEAINLFPDTAPANASGVIIYNNLFSGGASCCNTAHLYLEGAFTSPQIFNNIFDNTGNYHMPGLWLANEGTFPFTNPLVANNTFLGGDETFGGNIDFQAYGVTGITFENNVVTGGNTLVLIAPDGSSQSTITSLNNNAYENIVTDGGSGAAFYLGSIGYTTLAAWQAATGNESKSFFDTISILNLNPNGTLQSGSPAIALGLNLTGLGITALDSDKPATVGVGGSDDGSLRPPSGPWDSGAYAYGSRPTPPTNLTATVH